MTRSPDAPRDLTRCLTLRVGVFGETCDGCAATIAPNTEAEYRLDGAVFHSKDCAAVHDGIPLETKVSQ